MKAGMIRLGAAQALDGTDTRLKADLGEALLHDSDHGNPPGHEEPIRFGILEDLIGFHLRLANDRTFDNFTDLLGPDRLRPGCFTILTLIANNPGITQIAIARASGRDKSSVAKALRYMEDAAIIRRERVDDDRRAYASYVTEAGAELAERMARTAKIHTRHMATLLGEERAKILLDILKEMIERLPESPAVSRE